MKKELSGAIVQEIERRKVTVLPVRLDDAPMPFTIREKLYADFSHSYEEGLEKLLRSIRGREVTKNGRH